MKRTVPVLYKMLLILNMSKQDECIDNKVGDPVHFWPDPANQNFKNRIGISSSLHWPRINSKLFIFSHINQISSDIFMQIFFTWENGKIYMQMIKSEIFTKFVPTGTVLVFTTLHSQGRILILIWWKISGSGNPGSDPDPVLFARSGKCSPDPDLRSVS